MSPLRILFAGSGEFGLPALRALIEAGHDIAQVISQPDRPAGRGGKLTPTPVARFALERALPLVRTDNINALSLPPADLLAVIAFGQKIAPHVVNHPRLGSVNLHASLLPKLRGAAPINWAIIRGEPVTGNSVIRLAQKMDAGAILGQSRLAIGPTETAGELHDRLAADGAVLLRRVVSDLASGRASEVPQDDALATLAPKIGRDTAKIDWSRSAWEVVHWINGLSPWPGCHARLVDPSGQERARLTLLRAAVASPAQPTAPGVIAADDSVGASDSSAVQIIQVQPEGKRPMPLAAYRNGNPWTAGMRLESL
jgi:methionyl-tRNA formyltransferase